MRKLILFISLIVLVICLPHIQCDPTKEEGYYLDVYNETDFRVTVSVDSVVAGEVEAQSDKKFGEFTPNQQSEWIARDTEGKNLEWKEVKSTSSDVTYEWHITIKAEQP